ncbi:integrase core domain-containing protein [Kocuria sabuli]|uniref:integrase core domain-containing protein n=1 Tax=Kocuria sabuli TaxID=3071448 RepID=UPI0034D394F4
MQYVAVRCTQPLAGAVVLVAFTGDSYDIALAEAFTSLLEAELIRNKGSWRSIDDVETAVAEYADWFNHRRLHGESGSVPPTECEDTSFRHHTAPATAGAALQSLC